MNDGISQILRILPIDDIPQCTLHGLDVILDGGVIFILNALFYFFSKLFLEIFLKLIVAIFLLQVFVRRCRLLALATIFIGVVHFVDGYLIV